MPNTQDQEDRSIAFATSDDGAVSPNGKIIAGVGVNPRGDVEGWIATLP